MAPSLGHLLDQVDDAVGVAPLVVVPRDDLEEVVVEGNARLGVEDGRVQVRVRVRVRIRERERERVRVRVRVSALASKMDECGSPMKSVETTSSSV